MNPEIDKSLTMPNAQRVRCQYVKRETFYSTCGLFARAVLSGGSVSGDIHPNCKKALNARTCPAMAMRQEEVKADKPLYFVELDQAPAFERAVEGDIFDKDGYAIPQSNDPSYQRGWHCLEKEAVQSLQAGIRAANARTIKRRATGGLVEPGSYVVGDGAPEEHVPIPAPIDVTKIMDVSMASVVNVAIQNSQPATPVPSGSGSLLELAQRMKQQGAL